LVLEVLYVQFLKIFLKNNATFLQYYYLIPKSITFFMPKRLLCVFSLLFILQVIHAQKEANIWYFGEYAGLDFNTGEPVALLGGQLNTNEGVASIADSDGALLIYTDGMLVYNKNHMLMQNGSGLMGDASTTQSAVIVPKPLSSTTYYIFTLSLEGSSPGLRYSEVDMNLDGGLGAVTENKNVPLMSPCTEQLTAVRHANGTDIWVITHGYGNNAFHAYLITQNGVNGTVVTSNSGSVFAANAAATVGCMKASPNGTKLGICNYQSGIQLLDFNAATGVVSAPILLTNSETSYGIEFSTSGDVLYTSTEFSGAIIQYDLTAANIPASATIVLAATPNSGGASLQLGPNGKIYMAARGLSYLTVIHNPNIVGTGCTTEQIGVLLGVPISRMGLPNFVQSFFALGIRVDHLCFGDVTEFSFVSAIEPDTITWSFGDGNTSNEPAPSHTYAIAGNYAVNATVTFNGNVEIVEKNITITPLPLANASENLFACDDQSDDEQELFNLSINKETILGGQNPDDYSVTYHDSLSDSQDGIDVLPENYTNTANPQVIYVRVQDITGGCYSTTSFTLNIIRRAYIDMDDQYAFCKDGSVRITAPAGFITYLWSTGATTASIIVNEPGIYTLTVTQDNNGTICEASKTIVVMQSEKPAIEDIIISDWTDESNSITIVSSGEGIHLYSIDGVHYQESPVFTGLKPGIYTVYVKDANNCGQDTQKVALLMYPRYFTPNGDGQNETWHIKYAYYEPEMLVYIFDRYGKLITSLKGIGPGWDGTFNGYKLPSTDYWFTAKYRDGYEFKGHFSMIR
jgi:gliding motility-associated-like protein